MRLVNMELRVTDHTVSLATGMPFICTAWAEEGKHKQCVHAASQARTGVDEDVGLLPEQREALQTHGDGVGISVDGGDAEEHSAPVVWHFHERVLHEARGILRNAAYRCHGAAKKAEQMFRVFWLHSWPNTGAHQL